MNEPTHFDLVTIRATVLSAERSTAGHAFDRDRMRRAAEALKGDHSWLGNGSEPPRSFYSNL
jgi:hypothetical protein